MKFDIVETINDKKKFLEMLNEFYETHYVTDIFFSTSDTEDTTFFRALVSYQEPAEQQASIPLSQHGINATGQICTLANDLS